MPTTDGAPVAELAYTPEPPAPVAEAPQAADLMPPLEVPSVPVVGDYVIPGMAHEEVAQSAPAPAEVPLPQPEVAEVPAEVASPAQSIDTITALEGSPPVTEAAPSLTPSPLEQAPPAPAVPVAVPAVEPDKKQADHSIDVNVESQPREDRSAQIKKARFEDIKNAKSKPRLSVSLEKVIPES